MCAYDGANLKCACSLTNAFATCPEVTFRRKKPYSGSLAEATFADVANGGAFVYGLSLGMAGENVVVEEREL